MLRGPSTVHHPGRCPARLSPSRGTSQISFLLSRFLMTHAKAWEELGVPLGAAVCPLLWILPACTTCLSSLWIGLFFFFKLFSFFPFQTYWSLWASKSGHYLPGQQLPSLMLPSASKPGGEAVSLACGPCPETIPFQPYTRGPWFWVCWPPKWLDHSSFGQAFILVFHDGT